MAYYDALIAAWNNPTQPPPNVTGSPLLVGDTTQQKLGKVNAWTVVGASTQMLVPTYMIYNLIEPAEWDLLSPPNQQAVRDVLGMGEVDASAGTVIRARLAAMFPLASFPITRPRLNALAQSYDSPKLIWATASLALHGAALNGPVSQNDLVAAGGLS